MRAVLFVNGDLLDLENARKRLHSDDFLIGVDGGCRHLKNLNLKPDVIIGDFDSISAEQLALYESENIPVHRHPTHKDETDLELALSYVMRNGYRDILIMAATGNRLDHTLGNIALLSRDDYQEMNIRLDDGRQEIFILRDMANFEGCAGDLLSLIPFGVPVTGVTTHNLEYPLINETLLPDHTRGISNVFTTTHASVCIQSGQLICIHIRRSL